MRKAKKGDKRQQQQQQQDGCADCSKSGLSFAPNNDNSSNNTSNVAAAAAAVAREPCSWFEIHYLVQEVARQALEKKRKYDCVLGVTNGGVIPARLLAEELGIDDIKLIPVRKKKLVKQEMPALDKNAHYIVIDDIYDAGDTYRMVKEAVRGFSCDFAFCMSRYPGCPGFCGRILNHERWMVFPWETKTRR
ncbi:phosphoribosyltransferase family protein [Nitrososphaera sp.]|uniref:phosphoribosyltransferase n=1 Tax=Nitrososphaera sp. TaxID=1971748 RepID=UPI00307F26B7